jgi:LysM repeat protein
MHSKSPHVGPEGYILAIALFVPLMLGALALAQLPGIRLGLPSTLVYADTADRLVTSHPARTDSGPPPTLAVPTATPKPTALPPTQVPTAQPTASISSGPQTYTVQHGDELKEIAARYGVSIWKIIDSNDIPNPDSLRVGQVLTIPDASS